MTKKCAQISEIEHYTTTCKIAALINYTSEENNISQVIPGLLVNIYPSKTPAIIFTVDCQNIWF